MALSPRMNLGNAVVISLLSLLLVACERSVELEQSPAENGAPEAPLITGNEALPAGHPPVASTPPPINSSDSMPSNHPSIDEENPGSFDEEDFGHPELRGSEIEIVIPEEVTSTWQSVPLEVTDGGGKREMQVQIGVPTKLETSGFVLLVEAFLPSYSSDFNTITSVSNEPENPAVMVQLKKAEEVVARGWVFQNLPEYNTFKHEAVVITLQVAASSAVNTIHGEHP